MNGTGVLPWAFAVGPKHQVLTHNSELDPGLPFFLSHVSFFLCAVIGVGSKNIIFVRFQTKTILMFPSNKRAVRLTARKAYWSLAGVWLELTTFLILLRMGQLYLRCCLHQHAQFHVSRHLNAVTNSKTMRERKKILVLFNSHRSTHSDVAMSNYLSQRQTNKAEEDRIEDVKTTKAIIVIDNLG